MIFLQYIIYFYTFYINQYLINIKLEIFSKIIQFSLQFVFEQYQLEELRRQIDEEKRCLSKNTKIDQLNAQFTQTIKEKDQEILKLKRANDDLELQISKQSIQTKTIQRELSQIESINQAQIDQLQQSVKYYQSQVEKMRLDQSLSLKTVQERHDQEKLQLRQDYEVLINSIRTEYQQQKNEIREQLRNVEVELERKKQDYLSLKNDFEKRFDSLRKEMERMEKHFAEDQRGHSIALTERVKTEQINKELDKENRILNSEIQLMEDEVMIFKQENKELKNQVKRLEKMVYGKSNSISRKK